MQKSAYYSHIGVRDIPILHLTTNSEGTQLEVRIFQGISTPQGVTYLTEEETAKMASHLLSILGKSLPEEGQH